ncbi:hypothetical protein [Paraburkholderia sp. J12]|uniref:hypothetical protein n=1 Tax=Paraburkholderia sp. J12 TaxID=2805432 RepID=UPI002ABD8E2E|nr:hypothetical protein [Paraburkholderia sp. J12]
MGAVVIGVVFVAGLLGVPSLFGHNEAHAKPQPQVATVPAPVASSTEVADAGAAAAAETPAIDHP